MLWEVRHSNRYYLTVDRGMRVNLNKKRAVLVLASLVVTFVTLRIYLHLFPGTNFDVGDYNIHHLYTGLLLVTIGGLPLIFFHRNSRMLDVASITFGAGLSMALDEWVYLITTDGSDISYLLPISFWGAVVMISLTSGYIIALLVIANWRERASNKINNGNLPGGQNSPIE